MAQGQLSLKSLLPVLLQLPLIILTENQHCPCHATRLALKLFSSMAQSSPGHLVGLGSVQAQTIQA